jgi:hypothetical protein
VNGWAKAGGKYESLVSKRRAKKPAGAFIASAEIKEKVF